jgi:hypothetical protein
VILLLAESAFRMGFKILASAIEAVINFVSLSGLPLV